MDSIKIITAFFGGLIGIFFGGETVTLYILLGFVVADYITGLLAGGSTVGLSSKVGFRGIAKKMVIFIIVAVAHGADLALDTNNMFRDATIFFYLANEVISILENAARMNVLVPTKFQEIIKKFLSKSGETIETNKKE